MAYYSPVHGVPRTPPATPPYTPARNVTPLKRASEAVYPTLGASPSVAPTYASHNLRAVTPPPPIPWTPRHVAEDVNQVMDLATGNRRAYSYSINDMARPTQPPHTARTGRELEPLPPPVVRSVTPPPSQATVDEGWVTVSTLNMSPFMILRIKALIELAAIQSFSRSDQFQVQVQEYRTPKKCLSRQKSQEMTELEALTLAEDEDARCVALLNALLGQSRQVKRRAFVDILREVNDKFERERIAVLQRQVEEDLKAGSRRSKLTFSPGASLICFDSAEKPKKIRDNHAKHFHEFIAQQQQSLQVVSTPSPPPARPPTPSTATPSPSILQGRSLSDSPPEMAVGPRDSFSSVRSLFDGTPQQHQLHPPQSPLMAAPSSPPPLGSPPPMGSPTYYTTTMLAPPLAPYGYGSAASTPTSTTSTTTTGTLGLY